MKCYKFISLLAVFFAVTTLTHAQNAGPCTGSEYATDAEFFRAYASAQSSDATASKKKAMTGARTALENQIKTKAEAAAKSKRLDERTDKIIRKANEEAAEILREAKEYADETIKTMNKHGMSVKELEKQRSAVRDKMNKRQEKLAVKTTAPKSHKPVSAAELKEGMHVRVLSMNVIGTILSAPNPKGEVTVGVGSLTTKTKVNNLEIVTGYKDPEEKTTIKTGGSSRIKMSK